MSELENLHERARELEEAVMDATDEIERMRVAPDEDPIAIAKRELTREDQHARKVRALEREIAEAEKELKAAQSDLDAARMELDRMTLAAEKPTHPEGRTIGYALFAVGLLYLLYTCVHMFMR